MLRKSQRPRARLVALGVTAGLSVLAATAVGSAASPQGAPGAGESQGLLGGSPVALADCQTTDFSVLLSGEVNTVFDSESGVLELSALGPDGVDVVFRVDVNDPACRAAPALNKQIANAIRYAAQNLAADCASAWRDLASPEQAQAAWAARGITWTPEAAMRFLTESCGGVTPGPSS